MEKTFPYQNTTIAYQVIGNGKPVVLVHGFGEDSTIWDNQLEALSKCCQLIVPDLPGSGASAVLHPTNESGKIGIEEYADCIYALMQHEALDSVSVLGHSMGGYIALAFAEKYGTALNGLGLVHSTAFADSIDKKETRKKGIEMIKEYGAYPFLKNTTPNLFAPAFRTGQTDMINGLIERGQRFSAEALVQYYVAMMERPDRTDTLSSLQVPALFIAGSADIAVPLDDVLQQIHLPAISYFHLLEEVGHMGMLEAPALVTEYLQTFIMTAL